MNLSITPGDIFPIYMILTTFRQNGKFNENSSAFNRQTLHSEKRSFYHIDSACIMYKNVKVRVKQTLSVF